MSDTVPVSVVIPAYNRADMVGRAVRSVFAQRTFVPAEVLVVDDCSADDTGRAAAQAGATVIRHDVNRGEGGARNTGIAHATQEWIALLDSDDEWLPHLLESLWPHRNGRVLVGGGSLNCGEDPRSDRFAGVTGQRPVSLASPLPLIYPENFVAASGTMVRRAVVEAVGGYAVGMRGGADMDLWLRVLERGPGLVLPVPVVIYHLHSGQVTNDAAFMADAHRQVALRYADRSWFDSRALARWEGAQAFDDLRRAIRLRDVGAGLIAARRLTGGPARLSGAGGIVARRVRLRRASGLVDRAGEPTLALLPGADAPDDAAAAVDLRRASPVGALLRMAMRPTSCARAGGRVQALAARCVGVRQVRIART